MGIEIPANGLLKTINLIKLLQLYLKSAFFNNILLTVYAKKLNGEIKAGFALGGEARYKILRSRIENKDFDETELTINPNNYIKSDADLNLDIEKRNLVCGSRLLCNSRKCFRAGIKCI